MGGGDQDLKVEAIRRGVLDLKIDATAAMWGGLKMNGVDTLKKKPWEVEGGILKLKKELFAAVDDMSRATNSMARREARALAARKKKMKVVRTKFTKDFIDNMATFSFVVVKDLSDEELAQRSPKMREVYAAVKVYEAKQRQYWDTLKAQQDELGYAEDEIEVTDDEEEEMVKN